MDTSPEYVKMCDCPEIQSRWKPKVGDYMWRKCTVFGDELDRTLWPDDKREEVIILHYKSEVDGYYSAVNTDGNERIFNSMEEMNKSTCIWLPRQDQLQEMVCRPLWLLAHLFDTFIHPDSYCVHSDHDDGFYAQVPCMQCRNARVAIFDTYRSMEQLWLAFVKHRLLIPLALPKP